MKKLFSVKLDAKSLAFMGLFIALEVVLEYVFKLIPGQPQGGTISVALVPILLASYLMGAGYGLLVGLCSTLLQFALGLALYYGPWSVVLDYLIPVTIIGIAAIFPTINIKKFPLYTGIIVVMILKFISHYLSGAWLFAEYAPANQSPWVYSFGYNIVYCAPTLVLCYIVVMLIKPTLAKSIKFKSL